MIELEQEATIGSTFRRCVAAFGPQAFLAVPANPARHYHPLGFEITYAQAGEIFEALVCRYGDAGYGMGHRVALLMENRPEHLLHKLAINSLGACCVPLNADHRPREMAYVIDHAKVDLVVFSGEMRPLLDGALREAVHRPEIVHFEAEGRLPSAIQFALTGVPKAATPASVLYTSGTTGRPKGCVLSHYYELEAGRWYATTGGLATFRDGAERLYNPLPLFHVNASIFSFFCVMLRGNCQVQTDRFSPSRWWSEVVESRATIVHYLGVVVPLLLAQPADPLERQHQIRFAIGAGVDPKDHGLFEQRFGFPLIEIWGMTEMVRAVINSEKDHRVRARCFGRPRQGLETRIVDDNGIDQLDESPGELLIRHSGVAPRQGFFSGYLDDPKATETAWQGGWFHTGDIITRAPDGRLSFVERRKNIVRRSGENIAAAEVEGVLQAHPLVEQAAVLAVPDELREEEVLACLVLSPAGRAEPDASIRTIFEDCLEQLAYFKAPGWIWTTEKIPTTSTQKVQKHQIFEPGVDPRTLPGMIDLRAFKRRNGPPNEPGGTNDR